MVSSHWQQPGGEAWRSLSSGTSPLLQLHLPPWNAVPAFQWAERTPHVPHVASGTKQQQSSESQALCKKEKAAKPWVWTVGSHILACSLLSAPGPSCHPQEAQRANVQVRVTSQTPSSQEKTVAEIHSAPVPTSFHLHSGSGHMPWSWMAWGQKPAPHL